MIRKYVIKKLMSDYTPEQIAGRIEIDYNAPKKLDRIKAS
jgi:hypothetical protein